MGRSKKKGWPWSHFSHPGFTSPSFMSEPSSPSSSSSVSAPTQFSVKNLTDEIREKYDIHIRGSGDDVYWDLLVEEFNKRLDDEGIDVGEQEWSDIKIDEADVLTEEVLDEIKACEKAQKDLDDAYERLCERLAEQVKGSDEFQEAVDVLGAREKRRKRKRAIIEELQAEYEKKIKVEGLSQSDIDKGGWDSEDDAIGNLL